MSNYPNTFNPAQSAWLAALESDEHEQISENLCEYEGDEGYDDYVPGIFPDWSALIRALVWVAAFWVIFGVTVWYPT